MTNKKRSNINNNHKKKVSPSRPKRSKKRSPQKQYGATLELSECAQKYAIAIANPWDPQALGACIPRHPSRPSFKARTFTRVTVTVGTGNTGFAYFCPCVVNDKPIVVYSTASYSGGTLFPSVTTGAAGTANVNSNAPFASSSFIITDNITTSPLSGRLVSAAISWQYTGTVGNMGGLSYCLVHPGHENINTMTVSPLSMAETEVKRVDNKRNWATISSISDGECNYPDHLNGAAIGIADAYYPYSSGMRFSGSDTMGGSPVAIAFTGVVGNTFEVEMVQHIEYVGSAAQFSMTPSHGDSRGFEAVSAASAMIPGMRQNNPGMSTGKLMNSALRMVAHSLKPVAAYGVANVARIAGTIMGGPGAGAALGNAAGMLMLTNG